MAEPNSLALLYAEARARGAVIDLSVRAKWHLTGADRVRYLNGQVTNDIRRAAGDSAMVACVTTAKGRLCGVVYISAAADFLRVDAEGELREALTARLERYIIADDVTLEDVTEQECLFHVLPAGGEKPVIDGAEVRGANRFGRAGFDVIAPQAEHGRVTESLSAGHALLPGEIAEVLRIEAGAPRWGAELTEETLPAEAGLDGTAIDFHKGCYIGQEVISRIKSVGHVNRQLTGLAADAPLAPGMTLHDGAGTAVGEITSAGWSFGLESWAGLGYLKRGFAGAALDARSPDGGSVAVRAVRVKGLPMAP
jgi:folate-binding protein YgfZ